MTNQWYAVEGPDAFVFMPLLLAVILLFVVWTFVAKPKLGLTGATGVPTEDSVGGRVESVPKTCFSPINVWILGFFTTFIVASTLLDATTSDSLMILFSISCWLMIFAVYWAFYDALASVLRQFDINIRTGSTGLDLAISFLLGGRILTLICIIFSGIGLRESFVAAIVFAFLWFLIKAVRNPSRGSSVKRSTEAKKLDSVTVIALGTLVFCVSLLAFVNLHAPMLMWDNFTQWLILPQEMMASNSYMAAYQETRSVAPNYPPQQIVDVSLLLYLWGDTNNSENLISIYNPVILLLAATAILSTLRVHIDWLLTISVAAFVIAAMSLMPSVYHASAYGDARIALTVLVIVLVAFQSKALDLNYKILPLLFLVSSNAFTLKPYMTPYAFALVAFFFIRKPTRKISLVLLGLLLTVGLVEPVLHHILAPSTVLTSDSLSFALLKTASLTNFTAVLKNIPFALEGFYILTTVGLSSVTLSFLMRKSSFEYYAMLLSGLMILSFLILLSFILSLNPEFGNSIVRYLWNMGLVAVFVIVLTLAWLFPAGSKIQYRLMAGFVLFGLSVFMINSSSAYERVSWMMPRLQAYPPFPVQDVKYLEYAAELSYEATEERGLNSVLVYPLDSNFDQFFMNYTLARQGTAWFSLTTPEPQGPIAPMLLMQSKWEIDRWLTLQDINLLKFDQPFSIIGASIPEGIYTREEFLDFLE